MDPSSYTYKQNPSSLSWSKSRRPPSRSTQQAPRLGAISEDEPAILPDLPPRAHNRPIQRMFHLGFPPMYSTHAERMPPEYSRMDDNFSDVKGPKGETFQDLRGNRHITKRGGWKRLSLLGVLILIVVIALAIGLGVGLGRRKQDESFDAASLPPDSPSPNQSFPLGAYTFPTFLSTVTTSCTPLTSTWTCFPYKTYAQSPTSALATFIWIITSTGGDNNADEYLISTTANPFALTFTNATLRLVDRGLESEALMFRAPMQKIVAPNEDISSDGSGAASRCLYDETVFEGRLFTRRAKTYPSQDVNTTSGGQEEEGREEFEPWPYALEAAQTINMEPKCFKTVNGKMGDRIEIAAGRSGGGGECECGYRNFGT